MSVEEARQHLVNEIDKRLHISRLTNGFYEKTSDILMKSAFGFLMDQWISAGLLPTDFRGAENVPKKEDKPKNEKPEDKPSSSRKPPDNKIKGLIGKFDKPDPQAKKLKEFDEKFAAIRASPSSSTDSAPAELNDAEESMDEQEEILNDISLEELFNEEAFENQSDDKKQMVKVESNEKAMVLVDDSKDKAMVPVDNDEEKPLVPADIELDTAVEEIIPISEIERQEREAQALKELAQATMKQNAVEFAEAIQLQQQASAAAHHANLKTAQALTNQEIGTQLLAEAGAEMIEAGAHLQKEALASERQVPINIHQEAQIRQQTCISAATQESASKAHETVTFKEIEKIPPPIY